MDVDRGSLEHWSEQLDRRGAALTVYPVVIIGAGASGIASALSLRDRGVQSLVVDRADKVASSWRSRYDRLRLNTGRQFSHLPGRRYPRGTPTFPSRDELVDHLERHAEGLNILFGCLVERIDQEGAGWRLTTSSGDIDTGRVIVATGYENTPYLPKWPGAQRFTGVVLHSSAYSNASQWADARVLVVGPGSSGMEIAHDLAVGGAAKVWLGVRTPPNIILRNGPMGLPGDAIGTPLYHLPPPLADRIARAARLRAIGDLSDRGLPIPDEGPFTRLRRRGVAPAIIDMEVIDAIKSGSIEVVKPPASFDHDTVTLTDGARLHSDVVICATGYRCGLDPLVGHLGVLDDDGRPSTTAGPALDGLWFLGFTSRPSLIGYIGKQSRRIAEQIARDLKKDK
jgi:cation diffusion facilitator CzcD-associated flavoprotein CzcO